MTRNSNSNRHIKRLSARPYVPEKKAEAWAYFSRSGKTLEVYVRPLRDDGIPAYNEVVSVLIPLRILKPKGKK